MSLLGTLYRLQRVDQEWDEKAKLYQSVAQQLNDASELNARREAQQQRLRTLAETQSRLQDGELELESLQQKAAQIEDDLYSGRIRSPRELESLRQDGEYHRRRISELEDRVLELMGEVETLEAAAQQGQEALDAFEARWAETHRALIEQYKELRARLQALQAAREQLRGQLGRSELALYDELRRSKGGQALAPAREGICQVCRVMVPSFKAQVLQRGDTVVTCEGCGRILYAEHAGLE